MSIDLKQNYFALFGLPVTYAVDRAVLDQRYRELQRLVHPDRFASAPDQERRVAMQQATRINEGYRVLKDALARGRYLLELRGHRFDDERNTHQDSAFLMEQIELREDLAAVRGSRDPFAALAAILARIGVRLAMLDTELAATLAQDGIPATALTAIQRMQFFRKLAHEAEELDADLEDGS
ncbi:MAG: Fe-S protein assembly co-chaperone HscB [Gammaproteobacteria bacterium]|nr:Fe-S protein assembly co-chaperone HscB [Gammaproteobacteria bacterium]